MQYYIETSQYFAKTNFVFLIAAKSENVQEFRLKLFE